MINVPRNHRQCCQKKLVIHAVTSPSSSSASSSWEWRLGLGESDVVCEAQPRKIYCFSPIPPHENCFRGDICTFPQIHIIHTHRAEHVVKLTIELLGKMNETVRLTSGDLCSSPFRRRDIQTLKRSGRQFNYLPKGPPKFPLKKSSKLSLKMPPSLL